MNEGYRRHESGCSAGVYLSLESAVRELPMPDLYGIITKDGCYTHNMVANQASAHRQHT